MYSLLFSNALYSAASLVEIFLALTQMVCRDALLQLASKLEEQTRVQSDRENQFMNALSETGHKLESTQQQLEKVKRLAGLAVCWSAPLH